MRWLPQEVRAIILQDKKWLWLMFGIAGLIAFFLGGELISLFLLGKVLLGHEMPTLTGAEFFRRFLEGYSQSQLLVVLGVVFAGIIVLRSVLLLGHHFLAFKWAGIATARLQNRVMESLLYAPTSVFDKHRLGEIVYGVMEAPLSGLFAIGGVTSLITNLFTTLLVGLTLLYISPWMFLGAVAVGIPAFLGMANPLQRKLQYLKNQLIEQRKCATEMAANMINGIRDIKGLSSELQVGSTFSQKVELGQTAQAYARFIKVIPAPTLQGVFQLAFATVVIAVGLLMAPEDLTTNLPTLGVLGYGLFRVYPAVTQVSKSWLELQHAIPDLRVTAEWMALPLDDLSNGTQSAPRRFEDIRFQDVSFSYAGHGPTIVNVDFCIKAGKITGLVGESGSGKSSLIDLMLKFRAPDQGTIWLGNQKLQDVVRQSWLRNVGVVRQEVFLFAGTIRENLLAWKYDATEEEMFSVCRQAKAFDFINELSNGLDTMVGDRGVTLSGGQRQRIAIARVLLRNPEVLILDEALSGLDGETEGEVLQSLSVDLPQRTIILVSHRLTTIQRSNHIIVLDRGHVVEQGNHRELVESQGRYRELFLTQIGKEPSHVPEINVVHGK